MSGRARNLSNANIEHAEGFFKRQPNIDFTANDDARVRHAQLRD